MKYSILMPYCKRDTLHNTFVSFMHHYERGADYEVIIIEDCKNISEKKEHDTLLGIIDTFSSSIKIKHIETDFKDCWAPSRMFNVGAKHSSGDFLVLTNPECFHLSNVLGGFDMELGKSPDTYVIAACVNASYNGIINKFENFKYKAIIWYQHSKHNNRRLHFCSVISKKLYGKIGGFDEGYARGFGREDVDFFKMIVANDIKFVTRDDILVVHMQHNHDWMPEKKRLYKINKRYYADKWRRISA